MNFRTEIHCPPFFFIGYQDPVLSLGSCFAQMTARRLQEHRFQVMANPFGTIYSPDSLWLILNRLVEPDEYPFDPQHFVFREDAWFSLDAHSSLWGRDEQELAQRLNSETEAASAYLKQARVLLLTLGSARVFRYSKTGKRIANCQKVPASAFTREWMQPDEIYEGFRQALAALRSLNPGLKVILSLSPVRHLSEGAETNAVSKSILRLFCHQAVQSLQDVYYFPSYELLLDDLRDYRYYGSDLVHPSEQGEAYIWEKFCDACISPETRGIMQEWMGLVRALSHRPFREDTLAYKEFLTKTLAKAERFSALFNCDAELQQIKNKLSEMNNPG